MNVKSFCIDHPAATLLLALFIVCGAVSISAMWSDLPHHALVSSLTALLSLVLLRLALFGGLRKISAPSEGARTAVGVGVVCAGLAGGAASLFFLLLAEHTAFLEIGTDLLSAVVRVLLVLIVCLGTGVYEEALFRGIAIPCLMCAFAPVGDDSRARDGFPSRRTGTEYTAKTPPSRLMPLVKAVAVSAVLFAVLHLSGADAVTESTAAGSTYVAVVVALQLMLKLLEGVLFSICMAYLYVKSGSIWQPALVHGVFDLCALGPQLFATSSVPSTYLTGSWSDAFALLAAVIVLIPFTAVSIKHLASVKEHSL